MIDIEDLLLFVGIIVLLIVAFHFGIWAGFALVGVCLIAGSIILGRIKAANPKRKKEKK